MKMRCPACARDGLDPFRGLLSGRVVKCIYCACPCKQRPPISFVAIAFGADLLLLILAQWIGRRTSFPDWWLAPLLLAAALPFLSPLVSPWTKASESVTLNAKLWLSAIVIVELVLARCLVGFLFSPP